MTLVNGQFDTNSSAPFDATARGDLVPLDYELIHPRTSGERNNLMIHFHRAEIARMAGWRDRIDRTTNWSVTAVAAAISFSFSSRSVTHFSIFACMLIVLFLLLVESRRYRFFDVFRWRVRSLEKNYYAGLMAPTAMPRDELWLERLGQDLRHPSFKISLWDALRRRLRCNYLWLFAILLGAWIVKVLSAAPDSAGAGESIRGHFLSAAFVDFVPGSVVTGCILVIYAFLFFLSVLPNPGPSIFRPAE